MCRALKTLGAASYACKSKMVARRRGKKVRGERRRRGEERRGEEERGDGRCLPLPNDVGRIQNGRAAAAAMTDLPTGGAMDDLRRDRERR